MRKFHAAAAALAGLLLAASAHAAMIDDFTTGSLGFVPGSTTSTNEFVGPMLGGERDESVTNSSAFGGILAGTTGGAWSYGATSANGSASLTWDGADASATLDATGLGGIDLTESGLQDSFSIEIVSNDFVAPIVLTVYTSVSDFSQVSVNSPGGIPSGPSQTLVIAFTDLLPIGSGADFTNVGAITLQIDGSSEPQLDLALGSLSTSTIVVPEPATAGQLGLGLFGLAVSRRRRNR